jgi:hypothetical protein
MEFNMTLKFVLAGIYCSFFLFSLFLLLD